MLPHRMITIARPATIVRIVMTKSVRGIQAHNRLARAVRHGRPSRGLDMEATVKEISTGKIISSPSPAAEDNDKIWMGAIRPALSA
jgi:hypothetical protein